jgi:NADH dehydrogenase [ubiquinone] 1 alpha subcomplex assembly factor 7
MAHAPDRSGMTALELELRALIEAEGPMPVSRYMALCLGHPRHGYYATRDPLGAAGDFVTAPEISQMFGELIGLWCVEAWRGMREPARIRLVELGPGRGTLMHDVLRAAKLVPEFEKAIEVHLVETSPVLAGLQRQKLAAADVPVAWHEGAADLQAGPLLMIANEFVDALPIDRFIKTAGGWREQRVGIAKEKLVFGIDPTPLAGFDESLPTRLRRAPEGSVLERRNLAPLREIAARIAAATGAALIVDYGHRRTSFGDTLQAVRAHEYADPLESPGLADLSAHVDFESLAALAKAEGLRVRGPIAQGVFLRRLGIEPRAERLKRKAEAKVRYDIDAALARLVGSSPRHMGELFKVISFAHVALPVGPGFDSA